MWNQHEHGLIRSWIMSIMYASHFGVMNLTSTCVCYVVLPISNCTGYSCGSARMWYTRQKALVLHLEMKFATWSRRTKQLHRHGSSLSSKCRSFSFAAYLRSEKNDGGVETLGWDGLLSLPDSCNAPPFCSNWCQTESFKYSTTSLPAWRCREGAESLSSLRILELEYVHYAGHSEQPFIVRPEPLLVRFFTVCKLWGPRQY